MRVMMSSERKRHWMSPLVVTLLSVAMGFVVGGLFLAAAGYDPFRAFLVVLWGIFSRPSYMVYAVIYATPLILTGLSVAFAFRTGLFNIGAEGQFILGALAAALTGAFVDLPPLVHAVAAAGAGMIAAALWGALAGFLKARWGVNEVIGTIMLNWIALYGNNFVVTRPGITRAAATATEFIRDSARIEFFPLWKSSEAGLAWRAAHPLWSDVLRTPFNAGIFWALGLAFLCWWILNRTTLGYELRAVGLNPACAEYGGIDVKRNVVRSMAIAGALAGAAGAFHVLGWTRQAAELAAMEGFGFDGIAVALIGNNTPLGCVLGGFLFGALKYGGSKLQFALRAPTEVVNIVMGAIVFFVAMPRLVPLLAAWWRRGKGGEGGRASGSSERERKERSDEAISKAAATAETTSAGEEESGHVS
jgi:simple sugar transport system permease protein